MNAPARITVGDERTLLESMLDHNRGALIETVQGLSEEQARGPAVARTAADARARELPLPAPQHGR
jgi:hypothetical protein